MLQMNVLARWLRSRFALVVVAGGVVVVWFVVVPLLLVAWSLVRNAGGVPDMLRAIASLWWPLIVAIALLVLAPELPRILQRLRRASWGSGAIELDPEARDVEVKVEAAEAEHAAAPPIPIEANPPQNPTESELLSGPDRGLAFLRVSNSLEEALRGLGAISGVARTSDMPITQLVTALKTAKLLSDDIAAAFFAFRRARNRLIHGTGDPLTDRDVTALLDSGARLLRVVRSVQLGALLGEQVFRVVAVLQLYADPRTEHLDTDWRGIVLEPATSLSPPSDTRLVFPTKRNVAEGDVVDLKFDSEQRVGVRWYQDPVDASVRQAWSVSAVFVGEVVVTPPTKPVD